MIKYKVFSSGSCRLLAILNNGRDRVIPIHSIFHDFEGINFLGKLHNIKEHIQFIKFINNKIIIPNNILKHYLTGYFLNLDNRILLNRLTRIRVNFNSCDTYIFEISSLKIYEKDSYQIHSELQEKKYKKYKYDKYGDNNFYQDIKTYTQTPNELMNDLEILRRLVPKNKKIILQCHFRPNIIYDNDLKKVENREIIYNTLISFSNKYKNIYVYDSSILLKSNKNLYDGKVHYIYTKEVYDKIFNELYKYIRK